MKKIIFYAGILALLFAGFQACKQKNKAGSHNSKNSLDWDGIYVGTIPCADCEGIEVIIILGDDNTYSMNYRYLGKEDSEDGYANFSGSFTWSKDGSTVIFSDKTRPYYFKVGENTLTQLDMNGCPITGNLADMYVLTKTEYLNDGHSAENSLDWDGTYKGTIPCADCEGIDVKITLNTDKTYTMSYTYLGKNGKPAVASGKFTIDKSKITLDSKDFPPHYMLGENKLIQLDMEGNPIESNFAEKYVLSKEQ